MKKSWLPAEVRLLLPIVVVPRKLPPMMTSSLTPPIAMPATSSLELPPRRADLTFAPAAVYLDTKPSVLPALVWLDPARLVVPVKRPPR